MSKEYKEYHTSLDKKGSGNFMGQGVRNPMGTIRQKKKKESKQTKITLA